MVYTGVELIMDNLNLDMLWESCVGEIVAILHKEDVTTTAEEFQRMVEERFLDMGHGHLIEWLELQR